MDVVNIQMERALRVISVERGFDPREFSLFSFGGAGGLHATTLARNLGIPKVIISKYASTLSAFGMMASNVVKDYVQTVIVPTAGSQDQIEAHFSRLIDRGMGDIKNQGISEDQIEIQCSLDVRFVGQSYELNIPYTENFIETFHEIHASMYGYTYPDKTIEIVNIRVKAIGKVTPIILPKMNTQLMDMAPLGLKYVKVEIEEGLENIPLYDYRDLRPLNRLEGPALVVSADTTIFITRKDIIHVDKYQNLLIDINAIN